MRRRGRPGQAAADDGREVQLRIEVRHALPDDLREPVARIDAQFGCQVRRQLELGPVVARVADVDRDGDEPVEHVDVRLEQAVVRGDVALSDELSVLAQLETSGLELGT